MKNVGRYPDMDTSLAHRKLAEDRLAEVSMTTEQVQQMLDTSVAGYVTPAMVDSEAGTRLSSSSLATEANQYIDQSEAGSSYATLVSGKIPTSQLPASERVTALESRLPNYKINTSGVSYGGDSSCGTFTITDPHYAYIPIIFGSVETQLISGPTPVIMIVKDSSGRVVAGGLSTRAARYNRVNILPESIPTAYLGNQTFTVYIRAGSGSGTASTTNWQSSITFFPAPWTNKGV